MVDCAQSPESGPKELTPKCSCTRNKAQVRPLINRRTRKSRIWTAQFPPTQHQSSTSCQPALNHSLLKCCMLKIMSKQTQSINPNQGLHKALNPLSTSRKKPFMLKKHHPPHLGNLRGCLGKSWLCQSGHFHAWVLEKHRDFLAGSHNGRFIKLIPRFPAQNEQANSQ